MEIQLWLEERHSTGSVKRVGTDVSVGDSALVGRTAPGWCAVHAAEDWAPCTTEYSYELEEWREAGAKV